MSDLDHARVRQLMTGDRVHGLRAHAVAALPTSRDVRTASDALNQRVDTPIIIVRVEAATRADFYRQT
jgi:hypothetical protein